MTRTDAAFGPDGEGPDDAVADDRGPDDGDPYGASPDGERVFPALPPARGGAFARTWWGVRWLKALEETALDAQQLRKGRKFARQGAVGAVSARPGRITAVVRGADGASHRADVLLREFTETEWDRLLEVAGREAGHVAALLDHDMPPSLVEDAESAGVELLPGMGDLDADCDCGAWDHCPHTAALSYQTARLLDEDPFVLLLLRGRAESRFLAALGMRDAAPDHGGDPAEQLAGAGTETDGTEAPNGEDGAPTALPPGTVRADEAFAAAPARPPLPALPAAVPALVTEPAAALSLDGGTPPAPPGLDLAALEFLASDAADRARRMLQQAAPPASSHPPSAPPSPPSQPSPSPAGGSRPVPLTRRQDAVRLAARGPGGRIAERLADGCGLTAAEMEQAVRAWESGGADGLAVWEEPWTPGPGTLARLDAEFASALTEAEYGEFPHGESARAPHGAGNRWHTPDGAAQLRHGREGRWWPYRRAADGSWRPTGGPERDAATALAVAAETDATDGADETDENGPGRDEGN